jgi:hypothetical protein
MYEYNIFLASVTLNLMTPNSTPIIGNHQRYLPTIGTVSILGFEKHGGFLSKSENFLHLNFSPASEKLGGNSQK